jgi:hypothetical protein
MHRAVVANTLLAPSSTWWNWHRHGADQRGGRDVVLDRMLDTLLAPSSTWWNWHRHGADQRGGRDVV